MCFKELIDELRRTGTAVSESLIRWAIRTGKVSRPRVNGSLRFDFTAENVADIAAHFAAHEGSSRVRGSLPLASPFTALREANHV